MARFPLTRRFRFSLRAILLLILVVACALAWIHRARDQQAAVAQLRASNPAAVLYYDYQLDADGKRREAAQPGPAWLRDRIGVDYFSSVATVELFYPTDADLAALSHFPNLRRLVLERSVDLTDHGLATIAQLSSLEYLMLGEADQVTRTGLQQLAKLKQLKQLRLDLSPRTHDDLDKLRAGLPNCSIAVRLSDERPARFPP